MSQPAGEGRGPTRGSLDVLAETLPVAGRTVLDVGCGDGWLVRWLARHDARAVGVDVADEPLARARAHGKRGGERYLQGRAEALPLASGSTDAVIFFHSLHHVPVDRLDDALAEAARVLRPGGTLYVEEPLAEGTYFEVCRLVEDETRQRDAARAALERAAARAGRGHRTFLFRAPVRHADFASFRDRLVLADAVRAERVAALEGELRSAFTRLAVPVDGGVQFLQPMRVDVLTHSGASSGRPARRRG